jgi:hypothetical protein
MDIRVTLTQMTFLTCANLYGLPRQFFLNIKNQKNYSSLMVVFFLFLEVAEKKSFSDSLN